MNAALRSRLSGALLAAVAVVAGLRTRAARAQLPPAAAPADVATTGAAPRRTGFELELHGRPYVVAGRPLVLRGVAYEVLGLATLRPLPRAHVVAALHATERDRDRVLASVDATADADGRVALELTPGDDSPETAQLRVTVGAGQDARVFATGVEVRTPFVLDLLTDRALYEPGETMHLWARLTDATSGAPIGRGSVDLAVGAEGASTRLGGAVVATSDAGVASLDVAIPVTAGEGEFPVVAQVARGGRVVRATALVRVGRRTVERLAAAVVLEQPIVSPGGRVAGVVIVRTPSGAPVRGASVEVRAAGATSRPVVATTDAQGRAAFVVAAPAYLAAMVAHEQVDVRVVHRAYGTIRASALYAVARAPYDVRVVAAGGAVVPEVPSEVYLEVSGPMGAPPPANTTLVLTGAGFPSGGLRIATDARGLAVGSMRVPVGAAARHDDARGDCNGRAGTSFDVAVETAVPVAARLCVPVARDAALGVRVASPVVAPGGALEVTVARRPLARGHRVALDLLHDALRADISTIVATTILEAGRDRATLHVPASVLGPLTVRARPIGVQTGAAEGVGAFDVALSRPAHAFALELAPERAVYHVRDRAAVLVRSPQGLRGGHLTLVARDLAAHGGEAPYALRWLQTLDDSVATPGAPASERALRVALAALASEDVPAVLAPPLVPPHGADENGAALYAANEAEVRGDLRDPFALRDELLRRGVGGAMRALEAAVERATEDPALRGVVARSPRAGFERDALGQLVRDGALPPSETLGGGPLTVALLQAPDAGFTFDRVARRVARRRLVRLLAAVARFVDPGADVRSGAAGEPPERWLSRMVQRGVITAGALRDPWGGAFVLRRVAPGHEAVALAVPAAGWELRSPGPDHALGTADDVSNPFERAVAEGTVYAVASGEDALMRRIAALDPGITVLASLEQAYGRVGAGAAEDQTGDAATAQVSAATTPPSGVIVLLDAAIAPAPGRPMPSHHAWSGGGSSDDRQAIFALGEVPALGDRMQREREVTRSPSGGAAPAAEVPPDPNDAGLARASPERRDTAGRANARLSQLAAVVRERFPATVHVVAEAALDPGGTTRVEVPVADALTTYRVEAIAWTDEGWTTSASTDIRVDQDAVVDAPVPPVARVGDVLQLPARVSNRSARPIRARITITSEGDLDIDPATPPDVDVPAGDAREAVVAVRLRRAGVGTLVVRAVDAASGAPLDAARRPLAVRVDARPVRMAAQTLVDGRGTLVLDVPADATFRADGSVRVTVGEAIFGDPRAWGALVGERSWPAWSTAMAATEPSAALLAEYGAFADDAHGDPAWLARAVAALWWSPTSEPRTLRNALGALARAIETYERLPRALLVSPAGRALFGAQHIDALLGLAPAYAGLARRPELAGILQGVLARLRRSVENNASLGAQSPEELARAVAALGLTAASPGSRALELMRRAQRGLVRAGDDVFVEAAGEPVARVRPSALYALAALATGDRATAFAIVRTLARGTPNLARWDVESRSLACAVLARLTVHLDGAAPVVHIAVDGHEQPVALTRGVAVLASGALSLPGRHTIDVRLPLGAVLIAEAEARYGRPWTARPSARGPLAVELDGNIGARDARSALVLRVHNSGARVVGQPVIEIDLPAGAELDQDARNELQRRLARPLAVSDGTLILPLRALAPGGFVRVPLPLRWSVGGELHGLGVGAYAADAPGAGASVLLSRTVRVPDAGQEPRAPVVP